MQKNNMKTETVAEFLARGGEIKKVTGKTYKKALAKAMKEAQLDTQDADYDALPEALKIKYGIR